MNGNIGIKACQEVTKFVGMLADSSVSWKESRYYCPFLAVGCLQLYREKSKASLSPGAMVFYTLNVSFLNFLSEPDDVT